MTKRRRSQRHGPFDSLYRRCRFRNLHPTTLSTNSFPLEDYFRVTYPASYAYNLAGELTSITYPRAASCNDLRRCGRLSQLASGGTNYVSNLQYNSASSLSAMPTATVFKLRSRTTPVSSSLHFLLKYRRQLFSQTYGYGTANNGQIKPSRTTTTPPSPPRILMTLGPPEDCRYRQWGSRLLTTVSATAPSRTSPLVRRPRQFALHHRDTNRVVGASYDSAGNMTNDGSNTLVYDAENHVVSATNGLLPAPTPSTVTASAWKNACRIAPTRPPPPPIFSQAPKCRRI